MTHPLHSDHCKCECDQLAERIRTLHIKGERDGQTFCTHCLDPEVFDNFATWPCDTIKALQGDDDWNKISEVVRYLDDM